jgi:hypothetical protein
MIDEYRNRDFLKIQESMMTLTSTPPPGRQFVKDSRFFPVTRRNASPFGSRMERKHGLIYYMKYDCVNVDMLTLTRDGAASR